MRNVIVTGGSRGLGLGIVRKLAGGDYRCIAIARRSTDQLAAAIEETKRAQAGAVHFVPFDFGDIDDIPELVKNLRREFGPIYGLVNNAALGFDGVLANMHNARIEHLVRVNTVAPIVLTKYVVRSMMSERCGRVVNVASIIGFTRSLAREVGQLGVNVNAVAPGFIDTEMTQGLDDKQRAQVARRSALRRLPEVDDVAGTVAFLLGDGAKNITGTVVTVDAGSTA